MHPDHLKTPSFPIFNRIAFLVDIAYIPLLAIIGGAILTMAFMKGYFLVIIATAAIYSLSYFFRKLFLSRYRDINFYIPIEVIYILTLSLVGGFLIFMPPLVWLAEYIPNHSDASKYILNVKSAEIMPVFPAIYFMCILVIAFIAWIASMFAKLIQLKHQRVLAVQFYSAIAAIGVFYILFQFIDFQEFFEKHLVLATFLVGATIPYIFLLVFGFYKSPLLESFRKREQEREAIYKRLETR